MPRSVQVSDITGEVRVAEITTPEPDFSGVRCKIRFHGGTASLPEPLRADFDTQEQFQAEWDNWKDLVGRLEREHGYTVKYRMVHVRDAD